MDLPKIMLQSLDLAPKEIAKKYIHWQEETGFWFKTVYKRQN